MMSNLPKICPGTQRLDLLKAKVNRCVYHVFKKIPFYLVMGFLYQCLIPMSTLIYNALVSPGGMGAQDKWLP